MPRQGRIDFPGALHHVIIRGINRAAIFYDNFDRKDFLYRLEKGLNNTGLACYAWTLIPNHVHLLLRTGPQPLTTLMRRLLTGYALSFNRRHERVGYLFQSRYKSILCDEEVYLLQLVRYIHLNPLRAGLVSGLNELNTCPWCGHAVLLGTQRATWQDIDTILGRFGKTIGEARANYLAFVEKGIPEGRRPDLTGGGLLRSAGGWQGVRALKRSGERWRGDERIIGDGDFVERALKVAEEQLVKKEKKRAAGWSLHYLLNYILKACGADKASILAGKKDRTSTRARALFAWWATEELGYKLTEVAEFLKVSKQAVFQAGHRGQEIAEKEHKQIPSKLTN